MHPSTGLDLGPYNYFLETVGIFGMFLFCHTSAAKNKTAINKFHLIPPKNFFFFKHAYISRRLSKTLEKRNEKESAAVSSSSELIATSTSR